MGKVLLVNANSLSIPLADESVHMIATSPPYWGLRDYELGEWVGGEVDCDHVEVELRTGMGLEELGRKFKGGGQKQRTVEVRHYGRVCEKCGALRSDPGVGLESVHDCLGWARGENCQRCYVCRLRLWASECWRVLRQDGTLWLNLGDSYYGGKGKSGHGNAEDQAARHERGESLNASAAYTGGQKRARPNDLPVAGLKPKDLVGIPWRVALALQSDGWHLRSDIIWGKKNPMPESVRDRPTKAHEYIFLLTKSEKYYYDQDAIREPLSEVALPRALRGVSGENKWLDGEPGSTSHTISKPRPNGRKAWEENHGGGGSGFNGRLLVNPNGRNKWTVWNVATASYSGAHFACWPPDLVEPMIKAGTSEKGCCPDCGAPWKRVVKKGKAKMRADNPNEVIPYTANGSVSHGTGSSTLHMSRDISTSGWIPTCSHYDEHYFSDFQQPRKARKRKQRMMNGDWFKRVRKLPGLPHWPLVPCVVLDTFAGSATTGEVARNLGRSFVGLDLSFDYLVNQAKERLEIDRLEQWSAGLKGGIDGLATLPLFEKFGG